ncbi:flagellar hook-basal body complex protein [Rubrimonas sp.]|uniref:flagellar hook-basal body complex protein n=1 Tax=Rubrimonas sp. TaxID=2036015 RepID=UPI002FDEACF0
MDNPGYIGLTRMKGLADELRVVANNIANLSTTGYRAERLVFAEVLQAANVDGGALAMAAPRAHVTDDAPGGFRATAGPLDLAIEGEGFFQVQTPDGPRLTRNGVFSLNPEGDVVTLDGHQVLDNGGAPLNIPGDAGAIAIAADGTVAVDGVDIARIGVFTADPADLLREDGVLFRSDGAVNEAPAARVLQGFIEQSNVDPVREMARMIEVQRAYELGQSFLDQEDSRLTDAIQTIGRSA